jgi:hypothetical protein
MAYAEYGAANLLLFSGPTPSQKLLCKCTLSHVENDRLAHLNVLTIVLKLILLMEPSAPGQNGYDKPPPVGQTGGYSEEGDETPLISDDDLPTEEDDVYFTGSQP